ncbi:hypothetical protein [Agrococcus sp. ARC_14]|uniref:hypothetical protein n=1 Tax=Agrococcus sp. ARC_14 TaxID=2919927 RepID=UPI001F0608D8|nr:hypothetical protein [Agrococcus sp. ARC_14]MCH1881450.1 hypothetical protein [Agrococcus sp. ARC_14]
MLGRLGSGVALAASAVLVLVGCAPEPSEEELTTEARTTFNAFQRVIDQQVARGEVRASELEEFATPELARTWVADLQPILDSGVSSSGVPVITNSELQEYTADNVRLQLCTDQSQIVTINADGTELEPVGLTAWQAGFIRTSPDAPLLMSSLDPIPDRSVCGA